MTTTRILSLLLALAVAAPASAIDVNGQLKNAWLEKQASDPTGQEARIIYNTTEKKAKIYNGSAWQNVGSGSGSAGNLVVNGDAEDAAVPTGWGKAEEGGTEPTGSAIDSGANLTAIARTTTSGELIDGTGTWVLSKEAGDAYGSGWYYAFEVPSFSKIRNALNELSFRYRMPSDNPNGFRVYIRDMDNGVNITPMFTSCGGGSTPELAPTVTTCGAKLSWLGTNSSSYRFYIYASKHDGNTEVIYLDDLFIGQRGVQVGPGQSDWIAYTPTVTSSGSGTPVPNGTWTSHYRRVGNSMDLIIQFVGGGAGTASTGGGIYAVGLPPGHTIDPLIARIGAGDNPPLGTGHFALGTGTEVYSDVNAASATALRATWSNAGVRTEWTDATVYDWDATNLRFTMNARVPIAEWAGGVAYGENPNCEYAYNGSTTDADDTTSFAYGPGGGQYANFTANRSKRVRFQSAIQPTDLILIKVTSDGGASWPILAGNIAAVSGETTQNTSRYGIAWQPVNATDVDVRFGGAGRQATGATFGAAGASWADVDVSSTYKYRVEKCRGSQAVGFGLASATEPGLYRAGQAPGTATNDTAAAGAVGEYVESKNNAAGVWGTGTGSTGNVTSITLTPGDWDISFVWSVSGGTFTSTSAWIATASASTTGRELGSNYVSAVIGTAIVLTLPAYRVSVSSTTAYYLNGVATYSAAPNYAYRLSARRVR